ncbi:MAG TPA: ScpA family protein [Aliidongia sp.]|nr:ScpA family protein [Aliidongia sp.]
MSTELVVDLDGFEGPISLLLMLARDQKVDLTKISVLALADQYLTFINEAHRLQLELAADYLVMAAWLAYLKSRLLLPDPQPDDEPSGAELAAALQFRLRRLEAMQQAAKQLFDRNLLGRDVFPRGAPEGLRVTRLPAYVASLHDLLTAYAAHARRGTATVLQIRAPEYYSVDDALKRLSTLIGTTIDWRTLQAFLPPQLQEGPYGRSVLAATFAASLELAKAGRIELKQDQRFGPIFIRAARPQG